MTTAREYRTEEYYIGTEDRVVIERDGDVQTVRAYTRGTREPLYTGPSLAAAAASLDVSLDTLTLALIARPVVRDARGVIVN